MIRIFISVIAFCFIILSNAFAHDFWIEKRDGKLFIVSGHDDKWDAYDPARIKEVKAFDGKGNILKINALRQKDISYVVHNENMGMVSVFFDNYFWVKTTDGWKNITKRDALKDGLQTLESGRSFKYAKYIEKWSDSFSKPIGTKIEIIPLKNPLSIKPGEKLPVKVILDGKPLKNTSIFVQASHEEVAKTSEDGVVNIEVKEGHNIISTTTRVPLVNNPDADQLYLRASLSFEVKK